MFTFEEIASMAKRAFGDGEDIKVVSYRMTPYAETKIGLLGDHHDLKITVRRNNMNYRETLHLFVKSVPQCSEQESKFIQERRIFNQEAQYYNKLLPLFRESYVGEGWSPKCFLANEKAIVLEDLRKSSFATIENEIFDGEHLQAALRAQARLHAASLLAQAKLGKSPTEVCPEACVEQIYNDYACIKRLFLVFGDLVEYVVLGLRLKHQRIWSGILYGFDRIYCQDHYPRKISHVVSHGDCWSANYLFDNSKPPRAYIVDFQLTRYAPRMFDVAQLIYLNTTADIRKREFLQAVKAYHKELCLALDRNNPRLEQPSLETLLYEFEDVKLSALLTVLMYYPIITLRKKLKKQSYDPAFFYHWIVSRDNRLAMDLYDRDKEFAKRLNEIVIEFIEYCELHQLLRVPEEIFKY